MQFPVSRARIQHIVVLSAVAILSLSGRIWSKFPGRLQLTCNRNYFEMVSHMLFDLGVTVEFTVYGIR
jgi:hypothetical protein